EVPPSFVAAGRAAFAWRDVDAELAVLSQEPEAASTRADRADRAELRSLTFVASELTIELEITADALVGQIVPAQPGQIEAEGPRGRSGLVAVDEIGWFTIHPTPTGPVRLHLKTASGTSVRTEWTTI
ncbi:MAG TPA: hypothetical protein VH333_05675, partial [Pseudonocardiaceae bacterium]|nr:hypothetical protein [Pseudonocardiaceae bacterium]